jgi:hypothetical protein
MTIRRREDGSVKLRLGRRLPGIRPVGDFPVILL